MKMIYLSAANEAALMSALTSAGMTTVVDEEAVVVTATHDYSLDIIGTLYDPGVGYDPETETWETPPVAKSGYHANLRWLSGASVPAALSGVTISAPDTPDRG